jgi:flagellin-like hook-associated protein FlgL
MPIVVNTNSVATIAAFNAGKAMKNLQQSVNRLSSGKRITSPSDDAGGLAVHYKLRSVLSRTEATRNNLNNGISFLQVQDGAYQVAANILDRMAELKTFWSDISKSDSDRINYNYEFKELQEQLALIEKEKFNGVKLFSRNPYDNNPTKIITTEDGKTGVVDITRAGLFDNIDISETYRGRLNDSVYGGAYGGTSEPMVIKNFASDGTYKEGDIIRGRFENGQVRHAVVLKEFSLSENVSRKVTVGGTVAAADTFTVTITIDGTETSIPVTAQANDTLDVIAGNIRDAVNNVGLSVSAEVDTDDNTSVILTSAGNFTVTSETTGADATLVSQDVGRAFEDQHEYFRLLHNGDPVSKVFKAEQTIDKSNPNVRLFGDNDGMPSVAILDETVTGYHANQTVTIDLTNGAYGVIQANEAGNLVKGSVIDIVNKGDGGFEKGEEQAITGVLGGIATEGNTYKPGEVVYNEADRSYYLAVGQGGDYKTDTQAVSKIDENQEEFVRLGSDLPAIRDYEAFSSKSVYARHDIVYYKDKLYVATAEGVSGSSVDADGEPITPENDADNKYWMELSTYSGQGSGILDVTKDLQDFEVWQFVDYIQDLANSRAINGGEMSRLGYSDDLLIQNQINLEAADGRIIDADMALESTRLSRNQVLAQASVAMVAQANTIASLVLSLLGQ